MVSGDCGEQAGEHPGRLSSEVSAAREQSSTSRPNFAGSSPSDRLPITIPFQGVRFSERCRGRAWTLVGRFKPFLHPFISVRGKAPFSAGSGFSLDPSFRSRNVPDCFWSCLNNIHPSPDVKYPAEGFYLARLWMPGTRRRKSGAITGTRNRRRRPNCGSGCEVGRRR